MCPLSLCGKPLCLFYGKGAVSKPVTRHGEKILYINALHPRKKKDKEDISVQVPLQG